MSRSYEIEIEVTGVNKSEIQRLEDDVLAEWGFEGNGHCDSRSDDNHVFRGGMELGKRQSEKEAHDELIDMTRALFPDATVETRWRCLDYQKWDCEY